MHPQTIEEFCLKYFSQITLAGEVQEPLFLDFGEKEFSLFNHLCFQEERDLTSITFKNKLYLTIPLVLVASLHPELMATYRKNGGLFPESFLKNKNVCHKFLDARALEVNGLQSNLNLGLALSDLFDTIIDNNSLGNNNERHHPLTNKSKLIKDAFKLTLNTILFQSPIHTKKILSLLLFIGDDDSLFSFLKKPDFDTVSSLVQSGVLCPKQTLDFLNNYQKYPSHDQGVASLLKTYSEKKVLIQATDNIKSTKTKTLATRKM